MNRDFDHDDLNVRAVKHKFYRKDSNNDLDASDESDKSTLESDGSKLPLTFLYTDKGND